jgi:hypothetical protein
VTGGTDEVFVQLWGKTEQDLFNSQFMRAVNDKNLLRSCIYVGLAAATPFDRKEGLPVWVHYTENKAASDTYPQFQVCATPALWRSVLDRLENSKG